MDITSLNIYQYQMEKIRDRFETIWTIRKTNIDTYYLNETCALYGRKIVEEVAFGCLIALLFLKS